MARYDACDTNAYRRIAMAPKSTKKTCMVIGTGVKGRGMRAMAPSAMQIVNALHPIKILTLRD
jgi:hypothetical protein